MKQFFKFLLASFLGTILATIVLFCLFMFIMVGMAASISSSNEKMFFPKDNSVLKIDLQKIDEIVSQDINLSLLGGGEQPSQPIALNEILKSIKKAKDEPKIKGIYLNVGMLNASLATTDAVRRALIDFKESGKFIYAYADIYTQAGYFLSSVADKVYANPEGMLLVSGMSANVMYQKELLDKLGIEMQVFKVGTFKSAVEPFLTNTMSEANRLQITEYQHDVWDSYLTEVAESRHLDKDSLNLFAESGAATKGINVALEMGLIDSICYRLDLEREIASRVGQIEEGDEDDESKELKTITLSDLSRSPSKESKVTSKDKISVLYAVGEIKDAPSTPFPFMPGQNVIDQSLAKKIRKLAADKDVKAIVMRVSSPGGSAFISEQIWHEVVKAKEKKPIVVSMGAVAASGGYYISAAANKIVAEENTLTGSIGIFGMFPNISGLHKKIGIKVENVKTNKFSDIMNPSRPMTMEEKQLIQSRIEKGYDTFLTRCADGRGMSKEEIDSVGQGRIWQGKKAMSLGLVDRIGGLDTAIEEAAALAGIDSYKVVHEISKKSLLERIFDGSSVSNILQGYLSKTLGEDNLRLIYQIEGAKQVNGIYARIPFELSVEY